MRNTSEYEFEGPDYRITEEESDTTFVGDLGLRYPIMHQLDVGIAAAFYDTKRYDTRNISHLFVFMQKLMRNL